MAVPETYLDHTLLFMNACTCIDFKNPPRATVPWSCFLCVSGVTQVRKVPPANCRPVMQPQAVQAVNTSQVSRTNQHSSIQCLHCKAFKMIGWPGLDKRIL